jgi:hypothetical protein
MLRAFAALLLAVRKRLRLSVTQRLILISGYATGGEASMSWRRNAFGEAEPSPHSKRQSRQAFLRVR